MPFLEWGAISGIGIFGFGGIIGLAYRLGCMNGHLKGQDQTIEHARQDFEDGILQVRTEMNRYLDHIDGRLDTITKRIDNYFSKGKADGA